MFADQKEAGGASTGAAAGVEAEAQKKSYNKNDFFDTISCDAYDKLEALKQNVGVRKQNYRERMAEESQLNMQTFGAVSLNTNRNRYYRNRGRGGGGRRNFGQPNHRQPTRSRSDNSRNWRQRSNNRGGARS